MPRAREYFERCLESDPGFYVALRDLQCCYYELGDFDDEFVVGIPDGVPGAMAGARDGAFRAGEGVGTITKAGLPLPPGEPAINPVPRQMMVWSTPGLPILKTKSPVAMCMSVITS